MGKIRKIGSEYFIEFEARGLKYQQKCGSDKKLARELLKEVEANISRGQMNIPGDVDYDIFFNDFLQEARKRYSVKTSSRFKSAINHFTRFLKSRKIGLAKLSEITPGVIEAYKTYLIKSPDAPKPRVINLTLFLLREIFEFGIKFGVMNDNPTLHLQFINIRYSGRPYCLNERELKLILESATSNLKRLMQLIWLSGLRVEEALNLRRTDINTSENYFMVRKNKDCWRSVPRKIPITLQISEVLRECYKEKEGQGKYIFPGNRGRKINPSAMREELRKLIVQAGLAPEINFNSPRHAFARAHLQKGFSLLKLTAYLGLEDVAEAMIYSCFIPEKRYDIYT